MKLAVVFPNVMYREGPSGVKKLIRGIEEIGFHELDMFDHVVMGYPTENRRAPFYAPTMPILEAFTLLSFAAAITERIKLGSSVLVLPQRNPTLVAKQVSSLDTLSDGRMVLGVGIGWQRAEFEALGEDYATRGRRMDEAIDILRAYWRDEHVSYEGQHYAIDDMAMEPKPPQGAHIPIWIGGTRPRSLQRVVDRGDGWMAMTAPGDPPLQEQLDRLQAYAEAADRDPATIGMRMSLSPDALDKEKRKRFYAEPTLLQERLGQLKQLGFDSAYIDCVPIFQQGHRTSDALLEQLQILFTALKPELDK